MAKTAAITLGGKTYTVQAFTLDDLEEIGNILGDGQAKNGAGIKILKLALRNADPPASGTIRIDSFAEVNVATSEILKLAGIELKDDPTKAAPQSAEVA